MEDLFEKCLNSNWSMICYPYHFNKICTLKRPASKPSTSGLGLKKCRLGGINPYSKARRTFTTEHTPAAGSPCPMLDLTDPIKSGVCLLLQKTWSNADNSWRSPICIQLQCFIDKTAILMILQGL